MIPEEHKVYMEEALLLCLFPYLKLHHSFQVNSWPNPLSHDEGRIFTAGHPYHLSQYQIGDPMLLGK